jgi:hypothetical protein
MPRATAGPTTASPKGLSKLQIVDVFRTGVADQGARALQQALPEVRITRK